MKVFIEITPKPRNREIELFIELGRGTPPELLKKSMPRPFTLRQAELRYWATKAPVRSYGTKLLEHLLAAGDKSLKDAVLQVLRNSGTLYVLAEHDSVQIHSWEALFYKHFCALKEGQGIARIAKPAEYFDTAKFENDLRILVFLAASGIDATDEWEAIWKAVQEMSISQNVVLNVVAGQADLIDRIEEIRKANKKRTEKVQLKLDVMDKDPVAIGLKIRSFRPHILHLFCHGRVGEGKKELLFSHPNDWNEKPKIKLSLEDFRRIAELRNTWLVVLNACKGAMAGSAKGKKTAERMTSLVYDLVEEGIPAVIGMMERVDPLEAKTFTEYLYPAVFNEIQSVGEKLRSASAGTPIELEWAKVMYAPRAAMSHNFPPEEEMRQWTLPVLCVRPEPFKLSLIAQPDETAANRTVSRLKRVLRPEVARHF